jgi:integrase
MLTISEPQAKLPSNCGKRNRLKGTMPRRTQSKELETPFVFPSPRKIQKPIGSVKTAHRATAKAAKIQGHFRLYDLRHAFATGAAAAGVSLPTLAAILGHASIQMTTRCDTSIRLRRKSNWRWKSLRSSAPRGSSTRQGL